MRLTRAQAQAAAAQEAAATLVSDSSKGDQQNDIDTGATDNEELVQERAPLGELTSNSVDGEADGGAEEKTGSRAKGKRAKSRSPEREEHQDQTTASNAPITEDGDDASVMPSPTSMGRLTRRQLAGQQQQPDTSNPLQISIHQDELQIPQDQGLEAGSPSVEVPQLTLTPQRSQAKNLVKKEGHMRSTSNKENMVPDEPMPQPMPMVREEAPRQAIQVPQLDQPGGGPSGTQQTQQMNHEVEERQEHGQLEVQHVQVTEDAASHQTQNVPQDEQESSHETHKDEQPDDPSQHQIQEQVDEQGSASQPTTQLQPANEQGISGQEDEVTLPVRQPLSERHEETKPAQSSVSPEDSKPEAPSSASAAKKATSKATSAESKKPLTKSTVRQSTVGRSNSVRQSVAPKPEPSTAIKRATSVRKRSPRPSTAMGGESQATKAAGDIPHAKRRPMSMSFPAPAPPPKSSKAPTQSDFKLPGEEVAAKLKAAKEERLRRAQEQGVTKPTYKPPPPTKSTKAPTASTFSLPGEAVAAKLKAAKEERLQREAEEGSQPKAAYKPPPTVKSTKAPTRASFSLSGEAVAAKLKAAKEERMKKEEEEKEKAAAKPPPFKARPAPKMRESSAGDIVRQTTASRLRLQGKDAGNTGGLKRASSVKETTSKPPSAAARRLSTIPNTNGAMIPPAPRASTAGLHNRTSSINSNGAARTSMAPSHHRAPSSSKGKEVFARAAAEKDSAEKQRKEKEEAVKKAKIEAAERGRIASREWAAKMKAKKEGAKGKENVPTATATATATVA